MSRAPTPPPRLLQPGLRRGLALLAGIAAGVARASPLDDPESVLDTPAGVVVADGNNGRVLRIAPNGLVELVAGRGETAPCTPRW